PEASPHDPAVDGRDHGLAELPEVQQVTDRVAVGRPPALEEVRDLDAGGIERRAPVRAARDVVAGRKSAARAGEDDRADGGIRIGPESCVTVREDGREALTGEGAGRVYSRETTSLRDADAVETGGRPHPGRRYRKTLRSPVRSETPSTHRRTSRENRESPCPP